MAQAAVHNDLPEVPKVAFFEGHDADIPSNEGVVDVDPTRPFRRGWKTASQRSRKVNSQISQDTSIAPSTSAADSENAVDTNLKKEPSLVEDVEKGGSVSSGERSGEKEGDEAVNDPNIVSWDGDNDPQNPMNWSRKQKLSMTVVISLNTFITPLASTIFAPGVPELMQDFHSTNTELASFVVSVYILGFVFGPLFEAPLSELYGRLPVTHVSNVLFLVFSICCAVSVNIPMFVIFRFLQGIAGCTPLTIGGGVIADIIPQEKRGASMAAWAMGPLIGPVIGPVAGGYLTEAKGWRWIFWLVSMIAGVISIAALIFMRETYAPVLLERKAKRLRKETGNPNLRSKLSTGETPRSLFKKSIIRPTKMLFLSPIVFLLSLDMSIVYGYLYLLFTTFTYVFERQYGFSSGDAGLVYLGTGVGSFLGLTLVGFASDRLLKYLTAKNGGVMKPEYRLPPLIPGAFALPIGLFWYGWSAEANVHWIVPIIGTLFVGLGLLATFMPIMTYLVDAFPLYAASASAACAVLRSIFGAVLPLAGQSMYDALGLGWGNSLLAFISILMLPVPFLFLRYGERLRTSPRFQLNL